MLWCDIAPGGSASSDNGDTEMEPLWWMPLEETGCLSMAFHALEKERAKLEATATVAAVATWPDSSALFPPRRHCAANTTCNLHQTRAPYRQCIHCSHCGRNCKQVNFPTLPGTWSDNPHELGKSRLNQFHQKLPTLPLTLWLHCTTRASHTSGALLCLATEPFSFPPSAFDRKLNHQSCECESFQLISSASSFVVCITQGHCLRIDAVHSLSFSSTTPVALC